MPIVLIDWDSARPGNRIWDVGYFAWTWCIQSQGNVPVSDQVRRVRAVRDAYDDALDADDLLAQIGECQSFILSMARWGLNQLHTSRTRYENHRRAVAWAEGDRALFRSSRRLFRDGLLP